MRRSLAVLLLAAAPVAAQTSNTISPGMNRTQVVAALGTPLLLREADGYAYLFYRNQCTHACGMNDLVVLRQDSVVDAIFRSPNRHYTGTSSSPAAIPARVARTMKPGSSAPLTVKDPAASKPRMKPAPPNDAKPSIPLNPPQVKPAPKKP